MTRYFPFLALAVSFLAWYQPAPLLGLGSAIVPLLSVVMFCMGLALRIEDFTRVLKKPTSIGLGVLVQFTVMPFTAWAVALMLNLSPEMAVMTYLAGGDVALSVSMTLCSTLLGVVLTPWLIALYAGAAVEVDVQAMMLSMVQIVVLPIGAGLLCNEFIPALKRTLYNHLTNIATAIILLIIAIIVAINAKALTSVSLMTIFAVMLHNLIGLGAGYGIARLCKQTEVVSRTIAIEVGMQNSGLGVAIALQFFGAISALPAALFSIWHNLSASLLAAYWRRRTEENIRKLKP